MKKSENNKSRMGLMIAFLLLFAVFTKAQISPPVYPITNNLSCDVHISYEILDASCTPIPGCGSAGVTILAGQIWNAPVCGWPYDIEITVLWVDTTGCTATMTPVGTTGICGTGATNSTISSTCGCSSSNIAANAWGATIW